MARRAAIYCRISDDRAGAGLGVARQEKECRALCKARRWDVALVFTDNDISAYSGKPRHGYRLLLEALKDGLVDAVVAWHPDRLHRSTRELDDFIDLIEASGAQVATVSAGEYDLSSASGRMTARVVAAVARHESEQKRERIQAMHRQLAQSGRFKGGGTRAFGYAPDRRSLRDEEATLVRAAADRVLRGETVRSICAEWNAAAVPTVTGGRWTTTVLRRILTAPFNAGLREHRGVVTAKGDWPAIFDEVTHRRLRHLLLDPARRTNRGARRYLLTGYLTCTRCDALMVARPKADKRRAYVCAKGPGYVGCGGMSVLAEELEGEVIGRLLVHLNDGALAAERRRQATGSEEASLEATAEGIRASLDQLARDHYDAKVIDRSQFLAATKALQARLEGVQQALGRFERSRVSVDLLPERGSLEADWQALSFDQRRAVVAVHVEVVGLAPAVRGRNRFDPDRVKVRWRA